MTNIQTAQAPEPMILPSGIAANETMPGVVLAWDFYGTLNAMLDSGGFQDATAYARNLFYGGAPEGATLADCVEMRVVYCNIKRTLGLHLAILQDLARALAVYGLRPITGRQGHVPGNTE